MDVELGEAGEDVLGSLVGIALQRLDMREQPAEDAEGDRAEVRVGTRGCKCEAVAERARKTRRRAAARERRPARSGDVAAPDRRGFR
jgi:hypothetical protein